MKIKELKKTVNVSWSPAEQFPLMLAAGSAAQQVDASFNSSSFLELYAVNLSDSSLDLEPSASTPTQHKFQKLVWSGAGVIVGGCDGGLLQFYNSEKLLHSANESLVGSSSKHSGAVSALDINPYQKNLLASGASDSEIFIWDLNNTSQPMAPGNRHQPYEHVQGLAWNQQVQHILGSTFATRCLVWDLRKNEPIMKLSDSQSRTRWRALAWHPSVATQLCIASEEDQVPVIQLWDLRLAASPVVTMEGHQKGVMSLSWSHHDPDLLLSTGKDGRLLCWNPNNTKPGGEIVVELEWGARFALSAAWAPRCAGLLAACSDTVALHDLLGAGPASESASNASSFLESFGGAAGLQALPAVAAPAPLRLRPLPTHAPRWLRRPAAARFAFGGKLVTFEKQPQEAASQKLIYVSQVITDPEVVERATELDAVLSLTNNQESGATEKLAEYCRQKGDEAEDQNERYLWFFLRANFLPTFRTEILNLLGFKQDEIPHRFKGQANAEPTHDLTGLSRGESTETEAELSTDTSTDLSDTQTQIERKLSNLDLEPNVSNVLIPNDEDSTSLICRALVCGNLEEAVELCLESKRIADAMIVASLGSQELLFKVQKYHLNTTAADPVSLLSGSLLRSKWDILIQSASPNSWKNTLAALVTHCDAESLAHYCEMLGERLRNSGQASAAALCYACAADGNAAAAVRTDQRAPLALLLRTAAAVRARHSPADGKIEQVLTEYAGQLAGQGCLHSALSALNGLACPLQQRLTRALGLDDRASKHQQQTHQFVQRARTVSGQSQVRGRSGQNDIYNNGERPWPSASPMPQPPRPPSVGNSTGGLTSRSKYKVDPSVQSAPLYNQYSFNNPIPSQPQAFGYNSPIPEQYSAASVPGHNFTPINQTSSINPNLNPLHALNPISPAPMSATMLNTMNSASLNTMNIAPLNPMNSVPLNPMNLGSLNTMNSAALNPMNPAPLNPMNSASLNSMNPTVNGGYYNQAPGQSAPAPLPPAKPVQPGWNDPPMMTSKQKPKQEVQQQAPITHPLFGVEPPQHVPLVPNQYPTQPGQYPGQDPYVHQGQIGPYPSQGYGGTPVQQIPGQQYHDQSQYSSSGRGGYQQQTEMVAPVETPVVKPPLPQQYEPLQETFDGLRDQCYQMANNTQMKRKLEDVQKRLEILYDLLRENKLSEAAVSVLQTCAGAARAGDAPGALAAAGALAGGPDFAAVASFLPGLKVLMQLAMQIQQR